MTRTEARKTITKTNKLRKRIERLRDSLYREPIGGRGFKLYQDRLKEAEAEMKDGARKHREALKAVLGP